MIDLIYAIPDTTIIDDDLCERDGSSKIINGTVYDQSNPSGIEVLTGAGGCDSVLLIDLNYTATVVNDLINTLCFGESIVVDGVLYDANNPTGMERIIQANGCDSIINVALDFYNEPSFTYSFDTIVGQSMYQISILEEEQIESITWSAADLNCLDCTDPILTTDGNTTLTADIRDINGCDVTISLPILIDSDDFLVPIYVPNVMSLNSVTGNDRIMPVLPAGIIGTYDLYIYDRWGGMIYSINGRRTDDVNGGWNGMIDEEAVSTGVYPYAMTIYIEGIDPIIKKGAVTVL